MHLGAILSRLGNEANATAALEALGDTALSEKVAAAATTYEETPGEYAAGALRRFAAQASNEDWLSLISVVERSDDPVAATFERMLQWSVAREAAPPRAGQGHGCGCGGGGCGGLP